MKKAVNQIYETNDYDDFSMIKGNREIKPGHVKKLAKSIEDRGYIGAPIVVTKDFGIADGQHRFMACKELQVPFLYMVDEKLTIEDIKNLNENQHNWGIRDYVHSYAVGDNNKDYQWLQGILDKYKKLPAGIVEVVALRDNTFGGGTGKKIKEGKLKLSDKERKKAEWEYDYLYRYVDLASRLKGKIVYFYTALVYAYRNPNCDHEELYTKLMSNKYALEPQGNTMLYLRQFSEIYNKGRRKDKIFLHMEWAKEKGQEW